MNEYPQNYDARRWGAPYWFQNTRIIYWYLLHAGDYSSMLPMFDMYLNMMPISQFRCDNYFGHAGILIPETVSHFGLYANANYGFANENGVRECNSGKALRRGEPCNGFIRYHYNGMLELSYMMLKYLELSGDISRKEQMLAFIEQVLLFFDCHFDKNNGKLVMNPVSSLETWQMCVNDAPNIAGLKAVCEKLNLISNLSPTLKVVLESVYLAIPNLPFEETSEGTVFSPCEIKIFKQIRKRCKGSLLLLRRIIGVELQLWLTHHLRKEHSRIFRIYKTVVNVFVEVYVRNNKCFGKAVILGRIHFFAEGLLTILPAVKEIFKVGKVNALKLHFTSHLIFVADTPRNKHSIVGKIGRLIIKLLDIKFL